VPENWTANITFGGKKRQTLFITASKAIYTMEMNVKGAN
jgi:gluconolactonase